MGAPMTNVGASLPSYYQRREQPVSTSADIPATAPERHMLVASCRNSGQTALGIGLVL